MGSGKRSTIETALAALVCVCTSHAALADTVEAPTTVYEISSPELEVILLPQDTPKGSTLNAILLEVHRDGRKLDKTAAGITVASKAILGEKVWKLKIVFNFGQFRRAGPYTLVINLTDTEGHTQAIQVQIRHPAAVLRANKMQIVQEQVDPWPRDVSWSPTTLQIEEIGGVSGADILVRDLGIMSLEHGPTVQGDCKSHDQDGTLPAGGTCAMTLTSKRPYEASHHVSGALQLDAPQLAQPLQIGYDLKSRVSRLTIALVLLLGAIVGRIIRVWLPQFGARFRVRADLADLHAEILRYHAGIVDSETRRKLEELAERCRKERERPWWMAIKDPPSTLDLELKNALQELGAALAEAATRYRAIASSVGAPWFLPPAIRAALEPFAIAASNARLRIEARDAGGANAAMAGLFPSFEAADAKPAVLSAAQQLQATFLAWRTSVLDSATELESAAANDSWPASCASIAVEEASRWRASVDAIGAEEVPKNPDELHALVKAVSEISTLQLDSARRLTMNWELLLAGCVAHLESLPSEPVASLMQQLPANLQDGQRGISNIVASGRALTGQYRDGLFTLVDETDTGTRNAIASAIDRGAWIDAATLAHGAGRAREARPPQRVTGDDVQRLSRADPVPDPRTITPAASVPDVALRSLALTARRDREYARVAAISTTWLSGVILFWFYFLHFAETPVATWSELFSIWIQGLLLDLTVAGGIQAGSTLINPTTLSIATSGTQESGSRGMGMVGVIGRPSDAGPLGQDRAPMRGEP